MPDEASPPVMPADTVFMQPGKEFIGEQQVLAIACLPFGIVPDILAAEAERGRGRVIVGCDLRRIIEARPCSCKNGAQPVAVNLDAAGGDG